MNKDFRTKVYACLKDVCKTREELGLDEYTYDMLLLCFIGKIVRIEYIKCNNAKIMLNLNVHHLMCKNVTYTRALMNRYYNSNLNEYDYKLCLLFMLKIDRVFLIDDLLLRGKYTIDSSTLSDAYNIVLDNIYFPEVKLEVIFELLRLGLCETRIKKQVNSKIDNFIME